MHMKGRGVLRNQMVPQYILCSTLAKGSPTPLPPSVILFLRAATSGSASLCFRVLSSKWSLQVRPKIKRISPWFSAEKRKGHSLSRPSSCSTGSVLESKRYLLIFLLLSAFSVVWPCWPLYDCKAHKERNWPDWTQSKWVLSEFPLPFVETCQFSPSDLCGQINSPCSSSQGSQTYKMKADPQLMSDSFASISWDCKFIPQSSQGFVE